MDDLQGKLEDLRINLALTDDDLRLHDDAASRRLLDACNKLIQEIHRTDAHLSASTATSVDSTPSNLGLDAIFAFARDRGFFLPASHLGRILLLVDFLASEAQFGRLLLARRANTTENASSDAPATASSAPAAAGAGATTEAARVAHRLLQEVSHGAPSMGSLAVETASVGRALQIPGSVDGEDPTALGRVLQQAVAKTRMLMGKIPADSSEGSTKKLLLDPESIDDKGMETLEEMNRLLHHEYRIRRELVLKRVDVTMESFLLSPKVQENRQELLMAAADLRKTISQEPTPISVAEALTASTSVVGPLLQRINAHPSKCAIKSMRIGKVPDRGGRATEMRPKAKDIMPPWQARLAGGGGRGRGGRGGGGGGRGRGRGGRGGRGGGGGRVQGGWRGKRGGRGGGWRGGK